VAVDHPYSDWIKREYPLYRFYVVLTPDDAPLSGFRLGSYVWTPAATCLPARTRLALRAALRSVMTPDSIEEEFPETLLF
jgi:hypothetical protein